MHNHYTRATILKLWLETRGRQPISQGFTLIELLVVVLIVSVLAAIAIPNFLGQIGKSREAEVRNSLGVIARAQQAYHFEKQVFANTYEGLTLEGNFLSKYYSFVQPSSPDGFLAVVKHRVTAKDAERDRIRNYTIGVYYNSGDYHTIFCQGSAVGMDTDVPNANSPGAQCTNGGYRIK